MTPLKARQERFCQCYVISLIGTEAVIAAGYAPKSAKVTASKLLALPNVKARIAELQAEIAERNKLKADDVIEELRALAFWNIQDFIREDNRIVDLTDLERSVLKPIVGIQVKVSTTRVGRGDDAYTIEDVTTTLKTADKKGALVDLGRHLGLFKEDNLQKGKKIIVRKKAPGSTQAPVKQMHKAG